MSLEVASAQLARMAHDALSSALYMPQPRRACKHSASSGHDRWIADLSAVTCPRSLFQNNLKHVPLNDPYMIDGSPTLCPFQCCLLQCGSSLLTLRPQVASRRCECQRCRHMMQPNIHNNSDIILSTEVWPSHRSSWSFPPARPTVQLVRDLEAIAQEISSSKSPSHGNHHRPSISSKSSSELDAEDQSASMTASHFTSRI